MSGITGNGLFCEKAGNGDLGAIKEILSNWREKQFISLQGFVATLGLMRDRGNNMICMEEDIESEAACKREGEAWFRYSYDDAVALFDPYNPDGICQESIQYFVRDLGNDIAKIRHHLRKIRRSYGSDREIKEIESHLSCDKIENLIHTALRRELSGSIYRIPAFSDYAAHFIYDKWDMTETENSGRMAKAPSPNVYWQYDCSVAFEKLNADIAAREKSLSQAFTPIMQDILFRKCIHPAELLLDKIECGLGFLNKNRQNSTIIV